MNKQNILFKPALTLLALLILLVLTYVLAHLDLGILHLPVAMAIAGLKAVLVALIFMGLSQSDSTNKIYAIAGLFLLATLLALSVADYASRNWLPLPGHFPEARQR